MNKKLLITIGIVLAIIVIAVLVSPEARESLTDGFNKGAN